MGCTWHVQESTKGRQICTDININATGLPSLVISTTIVTDYNFYNYFAVQPATNFPTILLQLWHVWRMWISLRIFYKTDLSASHCQLLPCVKSLNSGIRKSSYDRIANQPKSYYLSTCCLQHQEVELGRNLDPFQPKLTTLSQVHCHPQLVKINLY